MNMLNINEHVDEGAFDANQKKTQKTCVAIGDTTNERCATSECYK